MTSTERDFVQARRGSRPTAQVPLVHLDDPSYEERAHLPLLDDGERHAMSQVLRREQSEDWRQGLITAADRRAARVLGAVVAVAAVGGLAVSVVDLVLHYLR